jgi:hypothetical protein
MLAAKTNLKNRPQGRPQGSKNPSRIPPDLSQAKALSVPDFATAYGVSKDSVYRAIRAGRLKTFKISDNKTLVLLPEPDR